MHDPSTVAFDIPNPLTLHRARWPVGNRALEMDSLVTVWHEDPQTDGSDDSCGYSHYKVTVAESAQLKERARGEYKFYMGEHGYVMHPIEAVFTIWRRIAWDHDKRESLTLGEIERIFSLACNPSDNLRSLVMWAQDPETTEEKRIEEFANLWRCIYRLYRTHHRRWWQTPRWHFWHWRLQIHPLLNFKRWAFSRCCRCGKGFAWGYSVCTDQWHGGGPRWFRSEPNVYHHDCTKPTSGPFAVTEGEAKP